MRVCTSFTIHIVCIRFFLKDISDSVFLNHKKKMLRKLMTLLSSSECRRRQVWVGLVIILMLINRMLLKHFSKDLPADVGGHDNCCDNCKRQ